jgi:guanylate kinase
MKTARIELKEAKTYDHVIVNDTLRHACQRLEAIISKEIGKEICA